MKVLQPNTRSPTLRYLQQLYLNFKVCSEHFSPSAVHAAPRTVLCNNVAMSTDNITTCFKTAYIVRLCFTLSDISEIETPDTRFNFQLLRGDE